MTCLVALNLIKKYNIDSKNLIIKVSKTASNLLGTTANLCEGDQVYLIDLIYGILE